MDLAQLQALDRASRTVEITIKDRRFTLVLPKQAQIDDATERSLEPDEGEAAPSRVPVNKVGRMLLLEAVTGWEGVTLADLVEGCDATPAPFTRGHLALLIEDGGALVTELRTRFFELAAERRKRIRDLEKNSASA